MNMEDALGLRFWVKCHVNIKVTYNRIVLLVRSAGARKNVPCSIAFLTMVITIATGINPGAPVWNIFRVVSEQNQKY